MAQEGSFYSPSSKSFCVELGDVTLYVNSWRISSQRILAEQSSVTGVNLVTNSSERSMRIHMDGIWVTDEEPERLILRLDEFIHNNSEFVLKLRELVFEQCRLLKYTAAEKGSEPYIEISLELVSYSSPKEAENTDV